MDRFRAGNGPGSVQKQGVQKTLVSVQGCMAWRHCQVILTAFYMLLQ